MCNKQARITKGLFMAKTRETHGQIEFDRTKLIQKRFNICNLVNAKLNSIAQKLDKLTFSEVVWLSKIEDFFFKNEYMTERQMEVLDTILKKY
jgi:hypothetical protein